MPKAPTPQLDAVIKLGGSVVTDKAREMTARRNVIRSIGAAVAASGARVILVHGTGSYGKPFANRYDYPDGHFEAERVDQFLEIRNALADLGRIVAHELAEAGLAVAELDAYHAFGLLAAPQSERGVSDGNAAPVASAKASQLIEYRAPSHVDLLLERGAVPLFRGDLYVCPRDGYRVVSSDEMTVRLAAHYRPRTVLFLSDVGGVYRPGTSDVLTTLTEADARTFDAVACSDSDALDVSGGMQAKVRWAFEAARHADSCWIANGFEPDAWRSALAGGCSGVSGTRVTLF